MIPYSLIYEILYILTTCKWRPRDQILAICSTRNAIITKIFYRNFHTKSKRFTDIYSKKSTISTGVHIFGFWALEKLQLSTIFGRKPNYLGSTRTCSNFHRDIAIIIQVIASTNERTDSLLSSHHLIICIFITLYVSGLAQVAQKNLSVNKTIMLCCNMPRDYKNTPCYQVPNGTRFKLHALLCSLFPNYAASLNCECICICCCGHSFDVCYY